MAYFQKSMHCYNFTSSFIRSVTKAMSAIDSGWKKPIVGFWTNAEAALCLFTPWKWRDLRFLGPNGAGKPHSQAAYGTGILRRDRARLLAGWTDPELKTQIAFSRTALFLRSLTANELLNYYASFRCRCESARGAWRLPWNALG